MHVTELICLVVPPACFEKTAIETLILCNYFSLLLYVQMNTLNIIVSAKSYDKEAKSLIEVFSKLEKSRYDGLTDRCRCTNMSDLHQHAGLPVLLRIYNYIRVV